MKKKAEVIKVGDVIIIGGEKLKVVSIELSDASKQGTKKCRLETTKANNDKVVIIRPADYPFECA